MEAADAVALVRCRVKARDFLDLVDVKRERVHQLPPDRLKDLNRALVEDIEVVLRRGD